MKLFDIIVLSDVSLLFGITIKVCLKQAFFLGRACEEKKRKKKKEKRKPTSPVSDTSAVYCPLSPFGAKIPRSASAASLAVPLVEVPPISHPLAAQPRFPIGNAARTVK